MKYAMALAVVAACTAGAAQGQEPVYEGKPLSVWLKMLSEGDLADRRASAAVLSQKLNLEARTAGKELGLAMRDPDRQVRKLVVKAIGRIGPDGQRAAIEALLQQVFHLAPEAKPAAARAIAEMGILARPAAPQLVNFLPQALGDKAIQAACYRAICAIEPKAGKAFVDPMLLGLKDSILEVRVDCAEGLGDIGPQAMTRSVPALLNALRDNAPEVRIAVARAVAKIDKRELPKVTPALVAIARDPMATPQIRASAVECLTELGPAAKSAVEQLKAGLKDPDPAVRHAVASALFLVSGKAAAPDVIPVLAEDLKSLLPVVRQGAADAIKLLGPDAGAAVPALLGSLQGPGVNFAVSSAVLDAIARIGEPAVPGLVKALNDPATDPARARSLIEALGKIGKPAATEGAPALAAVLQDRRKVLLHKFAVTSLGKMGPGAIPAMKPLLADADARVCLLAVQAFGELGSDARAALADLRAVATTDADESVRNAAQTVVQRINPFGS